MSGKKVSPIHGPGGLGMSYCGTKITPKNYSGDPDEVTCPKCRSARGMKPLPAVSDQREG